MAVDTLPDGLPTIPILATAEGDELYAFLERVFGARLLDRQDTPSGEPAYMTIRVGDSVISVMRPRDGGCARRAPRLYPSGEDLYSKCEGDTEMASSPPWRCPRAGRRCSAWTAKALHR